MTLTRFLLITVNAYLGYTFIAAGHYGVGLFNFAAAFYITYTINVEVLNTAPRKKSKKALIEKRSSEK